MKKTGKDTGLFQLIDRKTFDSLVDKWEMDKGVRQLYTWEMTCVLLSSMVARLGSYQEIEMSLGVPHSTFGDAMKKRYSGFFTELCDEILRSIQGRVRCRKMKRAIREVLAIDSSDIRVHGSLFSSPGWKQKKAEGHKAAAKIHCVWNVEGDWIEQCIVTGGRLGDSPTSLLLKLRSGCTYVFDRAYNDVNFWLEIMAAGSQFVTRLKSASIAKLAEGVAAEKKNHDGVLYDGVYKPCAATLSKFPKEDRDEIEFRYVVYRDPITKKVFYFVTSDRAASAKTIAQVYKKRWAVELLFRWLKGHLNIRYLAPKNKNAIKIQLAVAVLLQLLLQLKKISDRYHGTLWDLLREIRSSLTRKSVANTGPPNGCRWRTAIPDDLHATCI